MRIALPEATTYFTQPDWLLPADPDPSPPGREFIFLYLNEREVSATEDGALREIALGGPDTAHP